MAQISTWVASLAALTALLLLATQGAAGAAGAVTMALLTFLLTMQGAEKFGTSLLVAAFFAAPMDGDSFTLSFITISDVLFVLGFLVLFPVLLERRLRFPIDFLMGVVVLLAMSLISGMLAGDELFGYSRLLRLVIGVAILPALVMTWRPPRKTINALAAAYVAGQIASMLYAFATGSATTNRLVGMSSHPNVVGVCSVISLALLYYLYTQVSRRGRLVVWCATLIQLAGLVMSGSRGALIALAVLMLAAPIVERSGKTVYGVAATGAALLAATPTLLSYLGPESAPQRLLNPASGRSAAGSSEARDALFEEGIAAFLDHPFRGNGFSGVFTFFYHNGYLEIAAAIGVFGLFGYLLIVGSSLRLLLVSGPIHRLGYAPLAYFATLAFIPTIWDRFAWSIIALALAARALPPEPEQSTADRTRSTSNMT